MGLRLYQAPVESDIPQSKSAVDRAVRLRSSAIRRAAVRDSEQSRERRRRRLEEIAATNLRRTSTQQPWALFSATDNNGMASGTQVDDRVAAMLGERWAQLHAESNPSPLRDEDNNPVPTLTMAVDSEFLPRRNRQRPEPTFALSSLRSTQARNHPSRSGSRAIFGSASRRLGDSLRTTIDEASQEARPRQSDSSSAPPVFEATRLDGLGDRNRSLSPESDNVWETLLTTLTPDPQPPSVGSSFASASASAVTSQSTTAASSRTSLTTPDTTEEPLFEHQCESGCDNSDTEGEDDDLFMPSLHRSGYRPGFMQNDTSDDPLERLGGIDGMQRIIRSMVRREDIPDEWWAEAGLSRTLSRETSGN
ncbi:hypothetical protein VTI74DRAFT_7536 [Chaetomium olivicolor]